MPGFMVDGRGGEANGPSNVYEPRRKHRWRFETLNPGITESAVLLVLKTASRPAGSSDEVEMAHNQDSAWFAGRTKWEDLKMSFYDIEQDVDSSKALWNWYVSVVDIEDTMNVALPKDYKGTATLSMLDGQGQPTEMWWIYGCWPKTVSWGDLDYSASDACLVEVTMKFDRAIRTEMGG